MSITANENGAAIKVTPASNEPFFRGSRDLGALADCEMRSSLVPSNNLVPDEENAKIIPKKREHKMNAAKVNNKKYCCD